MRPVSMIVFSVLFLVACGPKPGESETFAEFPKITAIALTPSDLVTGDSMHIKVTIEDAQGLTPSFDLADAVQLGGGSGDKETLTGTGGVYEADFLPLRIFGSAGGWPDDGAGRGIWVNFDFDTQVTYKRKTAGDPTYTRTYFNAEGAQETSTALAVPEIRVHRASLLEVDAPTAGFGRVAAGATVLFAFEVTASTWHTVTVTPGAGDPDLRVCAALPCDGSGTTLGVSETTGSAVEQVTITPNVGDRIFARVTGVSSSEFDIEVSSGAGATEISLGTPLRAQTLGPQESVTYAFTALQTAAHAVFVYSHTGTIPTWTVRDTGVDTTYLSGVAHSIAGAAGARHEITLSHDAAGPVTFDVVAVLGDGGATHQLTTPGDNTFELATGVSPQVVSFAPLADATHTLTVSSAAMSVDFDLFEDRALSVPVTFGAGSMRCFPLGGAAQSKCTTTSALTVGTIYYLRLFPTSTTGERYGAVTINVATP